MTDLESQALLAPYQGNPPPAPDWFRWSLAQEPGRTQFSLDDIAIELLTWGEAGKPGLLFLHGDSAHADWWSFIAPFFARDWRCAAISWSGMGSSGRRASYTFSDWADEAIAAIGAAQLDNGSGVVLVAHSLGGIPALIAGERSRRVRGVITIDSAIIPQELLTDVPRPIPRPHRIYASIQEALSRFRFMPPTIGNEHYAVDFIARRSLQSDGAGWSWRFDPEIWRDIEKRSEPSLAKLPSSARCPTAVIVGERSELIPADILAYLRSIYPPATPFIAIPEAGHHVMVDQPIALIASLRACFESW